MQKKINIIIVGLDRCPEVCAPAFAALFADIADLGFEVSYFIYLWLPESGKIYNERSGEKGEIKRRFSSIWVEQTGAEPVMVNQGCVTHHFNRNPYANAIRQRGDLYHDGFTTVANYFAYMSELQSAASRFEDHMDKAVPAFLIRSDLVPVQVDVKSLGRLFETIDKKTIYAPAWHSFSYCNDRLMIGNTETVLQLMKRMECLDSFLSETRLFFNPEIYLWFCIRRLRLRKNTIDTQCDFARVRSNGNVVEERFRRDGIIRSAFYRLYFFVELVKFWGKRMVRFTL